MGSGGKGTRGQEEGQQRQLHTIRRLVLLWLRSTARGKGHYYIVVGAPTPYYLGYS